MTTATTAIESTTATTATLKRGTIQRVQPVVLIDTREQLPLRIEAFPTRVETLPVGDYSLAGFGDWNNPQFTVERKSKSDLIGSLTSGRERFWRELSKMRQFRFAALLVECMREDIEAGNYQSGATPQSLLASLDAIEVRMGIHCCWAGDAEGAARRLEGLTRQFVRGIAKDARRLGAAVDLADVAGAD